VGDDQGQGILVAGADVNEMDVKAVDLGDEARLGVQLCLALAPVVFRYPITSQLLHQRQRHTLGVIGNRLLLWPTGGLYTPTQLG
jgi:hypothetical protein